MATTVEIPKRSLFRAAEVCSIARVQPYVLKSWETEFPGLGTAKGNGREYRRSDVETVLEIKRLLYEEGLTLGAARRKLDTTKEEEPIEGEPSISALLGQDARDRIVEVKEGLQSILELLSTDGKSGGSLFDEVAPSRPLPKKVDARRAVKPRATRKSRVARAPKPKRGGG